MSKLQTEAQMIRHHIKNKRAVSIIESIIVIVVSASLMGIISNAFYKHYTTTFTINTKFKIFKIKDAIESYNIINGMLPCPGPVYNADNLMVMGSAAKDTSNANICKDSLLASLSQTSGSNSGKLYKGTVPYNDLSLAEDDIYDGWENYFEYFVIKNTSAPEYLHIHIEDKAGNNLKDFTIPKRFNSATETKPISYLVISYGKSSRGAISKNFKTYDCDSHYTKDNVNCNFQLTAGITIQGNSCSVKKFLYQDIILSSNKQDYYDDIIVYGQKYDENIKRIPPFFFNIPKGKY